MPLDCSLVERLISPASCVTPRTWSTISCMVLPALSTRWPPPCTLATLAPMRSLISCAACALRCASARTSLATTAKPRPCSPARAASTAAFKARMLVWKAMPSMTPMISPMRCELWLMRCMVATTSPIIWPPPSATSLVACAICTAWRAASALCLTVADSSSIDAAVCSRLLAWASVRADRSRLPAAISRLASARWPDCCDTSSSNAIRFRPD